MYGLSDPFQPKNIVYTPRPGIPLKSHLAARLVQQPSSLTWKWSIYNVFGLKWITETIHNKNPLDDTLSPLGISSNLHKTKMATIVLLNILQLKYLGFEKGF